VTTGSIDFLVPTYQGSSDDGHAVSATLRGNSWRPQNGRPLSSCDKIRDVKRQLYSLVCTATAPAWALLIAPVPSGSAEPCPDVEVVFARGTTEAPGVGGIGQSFVDDLRAQVGAKSLDVYPVNYPASPDFPTAIDGINDAGTHVESMAATCPKTKMVLGGYSQGAAVMGFVTANRVPDGARLVETPQPMPPEVADHVAAVALFGKPSEQFMNVINQPPVTIGPLYTAKTIDLCVPNDPVCAGSGDFAAHGQYVEAGMVDQAANFAATRLAEPPPVNRTSATPSPLAPPPHSPAPVASPAPAPAPAHSPGPAPGPAV
jgi:cutinase